MQNGTAAKKISSTTTCPFVKQRYSKNASAPTTCSGWRNISDENESRTVWTAAVSFVSLVSRSPVVNLSKNAIG